MDPNTDLNWQVTTQDLRRLPLYETKKQLRSDAAYQLIKLIYNKFKPLARSVINRPLTPQWKPKDPILLGLAKQFYSYPFKFDLSGLALICDRVLHWDVCKFLIFIKAPCISNKHGKFKDPKDANKTMAYLKKLNNGKNLRYTLAEWRTGKNTPPVTKLLDIAKEIIEDKNHQ